MLSMQINWIARGVGLLLIGIVVSSIVIRQHRYSGDLRICSTIWAFHFDYERNYLMFDDGILADQAFGMQKCAKDVDIRDCSLSIISFVNPDKVKPEDVDFDFEVKRSDKNTIVEIKNLEMDKTWAVAASLFSLMMVRL